MGKFEKKKYLLVLIIGLFTAQIAYGDSEGELYSNLENRKSHIYTREKGKSFIREGYMQKFRGERGVSGSNQHIEYVTGVRKLDETTHYRGYRGEVNGILIGTTSTFNPRIDGVSMAGVSFSYIESDIDFNNSNNKDKSETINVNALGAYEHYGNIIMGYTGFSKGKTDHTDEEKVFTAGMELGRVQNLGLGQQFYPYLSATAGRAFKDDFTYQGTKYKNDNETFIEYRVGGEYQIYYKRIYCKLFGEYINNNIKSGNTLMTEMPDGREKKVNIPGNDREKFRYGIVVGYKLDDTLTLSGEISKIESSINDDIVGGLRISHRF